MAPVGGWKRGVMGVCGWVRRVGVEVGVGGRGSGRGSGRGQG